MKNVIRKEISRLSSIANSLRYSSSPDDIGYLEELTWEIEVLETKLSNL